jgi:hypothetical protein
MRNSLIINDLQAAAGRPSVTRWYSTTYKGYYVPLRAFHARHFFSTALGSASDPNKVLKISQDGFGSVSDRHAVMRSFGVMLGYSV